MDSGEGKTVAAAFPAALHAICGSAVHIMTSNDYLAVRDAELLAPVYESLGLTVGFRRGLHERGREATRLRPKHRLRNAARVHPAERTTRGTAGKWLAGTSGASERVSEALKAP